jgi:hypothetical protein
VSIFAAVYALAATCLYVDCGHRAVEEMPDLHGKSIDEVTRTLGEPDDQHFLYYYPPDRPDSRDVAIKELWWKRRRYTVVVWFHQVGEQWIAFDTCRWKEGVEF